MVDRYQSIVENIQGSPRRNRNSSVLLDSNDRRLRDLMKETESHAINMKTCIHKYRDATTAETEHEIMLNYKREQKQLQDGRQLLAQQLKSLDQSGKTSARRLQVKQRLLMTVHRELKLDAQMNEVVSTKEHQLELELNKLAPGSQNLKNALVDIKQKRDQIIYLQEQARELVQLLDVVGVLVLENSEKIETTLESVKRANDHVDKSHKIIDLRRKRSKKLRDSLCNIF